MNERGRFVALAAEGLFTVSELCARFGISRKSGYKWLARYRQGGLTALADAPRAPHSCPHHTPLSVEKVLLQAREAPPHWGPKKLLPYVQKRHPELVLPAPSTVGALLKRHGLIPSRRPRRRAPAAAAPPLVTEAPNQVWCADFKGEFRTRDGRWCYPLTVTDAHRRVLLACQALPATTTEGAVAVFMRLFAE